MSAIQAVAYAWHRALAVAFAGFIAFLLYVAFVSIGPGAEGRFFPVIKNYKMTEVKVDPRGGFSFIPTFEKTRDCTYHGITWFSPDEKGNLSRIQGRREEETNNPPMTGPLGSRIGIKQSLVPPKSAISIFAIMHHECGFIWQTRTTIGPFLLKDIIPQDNVTEKYNGTFKTSSIETY